MAWSAVTNTRKDCKRQGPSLWIGWHGSFCVSLLWCSTWGVWGLISPSGGQKMKPAELYYSGPTQYPVGYVKATSVMTGSPTWPWSCLCFHQRRPDFRWDTLFLSRLKRALHVFSPVFHNPRNASAAWINHLQIVSRLFPSARSRELETISWLWLLPLWVMGSCGSWGHVRHLENYAAHGIKWSTEPSDWVDWASCPFGAILSIASWALELKIFQKYFEVYWERTLAEISEFSCRPPHGASRTKLLWDKADTHLLNLCLFSKKLAVSLAPFSFSPRS